MDRVSVTGLQLWQWLQGAIQAAQATDVVSAKVDWLLQEIAGLERLVLSPTANKPPTISLQKK
jgi:release factor glutamine methyltransferase